MANPLLRAAVLPNGKMISITEVDCLFCCGRVAFPTKPREEDGVIVSHTNPPCHVWDTYDDPVDFMEAFRNEIRRRFN